MVIQEFIQTNPKLSIALLSFIATLFITILTYFITDKEKMKNIKQKQKKLRDEMKQHKDNPQKLAEINQQMLEDFPHQMKESMKIMIITMVPILIFFSWLRKVFILTAIANTWIWWYMGFSIVSSIFIRKILKMD